MKRVTSVIALAALALAVAAYFKVRSPVASAVAPPAAAQVALEHSDSARLWQRMDDMQRSLAAIEQQMAAQQRQLAAPRPTPAGESAPFDREAMEAQRTADLERNQAYMVQVHQAFANEKVDAAWAARTSARVGAAFEGEQSLRGIAHTVECRQQTCRVQIDDDGSLNARLPRLALGVADVLPTISAERVELGNGRQAMVLYMSSQRTAPASRSSR